MILWLFYHELNTNFRFEYLFISSSIFTYHTEATNNTSSFLLTDFLRIVMARTYMIYYGISIRMPHAQLSICVPLRFYLARTVGLLCTLHMNEVFTHNVVFPKTSYITISLFFVSITVRFKFKSYKRWFFHPFTVHPNKLGISWNFMVFL